MKITDEMVEDAAKAIYECDVQPGDWVWSKVRDRHRLALGRAALEAALLTDDGAADTPPADTGVRSAQAAESATPVGAGAAAPSSPLLSEILAVIDGERGYMDNWAGRARNDALTDAREAVEKLFADRAATPAIDREALTELLRFNRHAPYVSNERLADMVAALIEGAS